MTANTHLSTILRELNREAVEIPPGFKTAREWAQEWGCSESHGIRLCNARVREGKMEWKAFRIKTGQRLYPVPHYRATKA